MCWCSIISGMMGAGRIICDCVCVHIMCVVTRFYLCSLILQIWKPHPNYPCVSSFCLTLSLSPGKLLFSVSFLVFLLMLILLGKGFTVTRWGGCTFLQFFYVYVYFYMFVSGTLFRWVHRAIICLSLSQHGF